MYILQGRHPKLEPVELDMGSLNSGGSFIFERPGYLTVWTGKFVSEKMQGKLRKVMKKIGEERGGQPEVLVSLGIFLGSGILPASFML